MTEERLKEIKDSLDTPIWIFTQRTFAKSYMEIHLQQELELYNEVIRLKKIIDKATNKIEQYDLITGYYQGNYDNFYDDYSHDTLKDDLLDIIKQNNITLEQPNGVENA